jgi:geranylgeranyl diphosphate synthase type I
MFSETLKENAAAVEKRITSFFDDVSHTTISSLFDTRAGSLLLDEVRELTLRGGKRLRAALLINGAALFDDEAAGSPAVLDAAAALGLLHAYLLIHDDIMDGDDVRRGGPAVHAALAAALQDEELGQGLGILAGDLAAALSGLLLSRIDADPARHQRVTRIFTEMHLDVVHGQTLDMLGAADALEVAARKTASYTTVGPMAIGATLGGASAEEVAEIARLARPLGVAFQLRDDLLGTFGSSDTTGKPNDTDLKGGKRTYLLAEALERANDEQRRAIDAVLGVEGANDDEVDRARQALVDCGAKDACVSRIAEGVAEFVKGVAGGDYRDGGKRFLLGVARYIAERER